MITTRIMELRKRRGLMIALVVVNIGIPTLFLVIRLLAHAFAPKSYGPAGGYDIYTSLVAGVMYVFGFIVAATLGCTAGSVDLTDGMFRHLVVTGRSRLALYLARIPAGLAIVLPLVAVGFTIVCAVCVFAAPTQLNYDGATVPARLSLPASRTGPPPIADEVVCDLPFRTGRRRRSSRGPAVPCGPNGPGRCVEATRGSDAPAPNRHRPSPRPRPDRSPGRTTADYTRQFLYPSNSLMIKTGLWLELEATIGFMVGLGLGSLLGQRTVAVVLMIVLEIILTPIVSTHVIPHLINVRAGRWSDWPPPIWNRAGLPVAFGPGAAVRAAAAIDLVPESITVAVCVIVAWLVGWTVLGAWRMMTRDA